MRMIIHVTSIHNTPQVHRNVNQIVTDREEIRFYEDENYWPYKYKDLIDFYVEIIER